MKKRLYSKLPLVVSALGLLLADRGHAANFTADNLFSTINTTVGTGTSGGELVVIGQTGSSVEPALSLTGDGGVIFTGNMYDSSDSYAGTAEFLWYPKKSALLSGSTVATSDTDIGFYSFAYGNSTASGDGSVAFYNSTASGVGSTAMGQSSATGDYSFAAADAIATGEGDVALGESSQAVGGDNFAAGWSATAQGGSVSIGNTTISDGYGSVALGYGSSAGSPYSMAIGYYNYTFDQHSLALGNGNYADYPYSASIGSGNDTQGSYSTAIGTGNFTHASNANAIGTGLTSDSFASTTLGIYNVAITGDSSNWAAADSLFIIGNGNFAVAPHNALVMYKNGKIELYGTNSTTAKIVLDPDNSQITVNGASLLVPNSSGNLGIGTGSTTPLTKLQVVGRTGTYGQETLGGASDAGMLTFRSGASGGAATGQIGYVTSATEANLFDIASNSTSGVIRLDTAGAERLRIDSSGNVGIGTASSNSALNVKGVLSVFGTTQNSTSASSSGDIILPYGQSYRFTNDSNNSSVGMISLGTYGGVGDSLLIGNTSATPLSWPATIQFRTGSYPTAATERMRIDANGNVGIGTTTPAAMLNVNGTTALGTGIAAPSFSSTVVGAYNRQEGSATLWQLTDPAFTVANGTGVTTDPADKKNHNAFVVYKNGMVSLYANGTGSTTAAPTIVLNPNTSQILLGTSPVATTDPGGNMSVTGSLGIGTPPASAKLDVASNSGVIFSGTSGTGTLPTAPTGSTQFIWYSNKGALLGGENATTSASAIGQDSFEFGNGNYAGGVSAASFGTSSSASADYSFAAGQGSGAGGKYSVAMGNASVAWGEGAVAFGNAQAGGDYSASFGSSFVLGNYSLASGDSTIYTGVYATALGQSVVSGDDALASGWSQAEATGAVALGAGSYAGDYGAFAGGEAEIEGYDSAGFGQAYTTADYSFAAGQSTASAQDSTAIGNATAAGSSSTALGASYASGDYSFAAGEASTDGFGSISIGTGVTEGDYTIALEGNASGDDSMAIGYNSTASEQFAAAIGVSSTASGEASMALGYNSTAYALDSLAIGVSSNAYGGGSLALSGGTAGGNGSTAIGPGAYAVGNFSVAIGHSTQTSSYFGTALGTWNVPVSGESSTTWNAIDPLFIIGNGVGFPAVGPAPFVGEHNALVMLKNGKINLYGTNSTTPKIVIDPDNGTITVGGNALTFDTNSDWAWGPSASAQGTGSLAIGTHSTTTSSSYYGLAMIGGTSESSGAIAIGGGTYASGNNSVVVGSGGTATGSAALSLAGGIANSDGAISIGRNTSATGIDAVALGRGTASGFNSVAFGSSTASGAASVALGVLATAGGGNSFAEGWDSYSSGMYSVAIGGASAGGDYSVAIGNGNSSVGQYSSALGVGTYAKALDSMAVGSYNTLDSTSNATTWTAADPVFTVGNGSSASTRSNALVVYKNGTVVIPKRQGDIVMGAFGNTGSGD